MKSILFYRKYNFNKSIIAFRYVLLLILHIACGQRFVNNIFERSVKKYLAT